MYTRYNYHDPANVNYGRYGMPGTFQPLVIDSNRNFSIQLSRHCNGVCTYDIGAVTPNNKQQEINECSDITGAPYMCTMGYLGAKVQIKGSPKYDRLG
jgi:hypothetical protein